MYFPQRFQAWLLSCLPPVGHRHPDVYRFFLLPRGGHHVLEFRSGQEEEAKVKALEIPESFSGPSTAECVEALSVLFEAELCRHTPVGQALRDKVLLQTVLGTIEISPPGSWPRALTRSTTPAGHAASP